MRELTVGERRYRIVAVAQGTQWIAHAERLDTDDRFGVECAAASEDGAVERLAKWLDWQAEHAQALDSLRQAERVYHRSMAIVAFASAPERPLEQRAQAAAALESARNHLDRIRGRRPG